IVEFIDVSAAMATKTPMSCEPVSPNARCTTSIPIAWLCRNVSKPSPFDIPITNTKYTSVMMTMESNSDVSTARGPPRTSAETYAASFQPPKVSTTNTIAKPNAPTPPLLGVETATVVSGAIMKPANATNSTPPISSRVSTFCRCAELRRPTMLIAVSSTTASAAYSPEG